MRRRCGHGSGENIGHYALYYSKASGFFQYITALLRYNSHTNHSKCTIQWFSVYSQSCAIITTINFKTFSSSPKDNPYLFIPITSHFRFPCNSPSPRQPLIYFVSIDLPILGISYKSNHAISNLMFFFFN